MKKILFLFLCFVISLTLIACNSEDIKDALDDLKTLDTPLVTISEDGVASWEKVKHADGYAYKINNESAVKTDELEVQLEYGDSIRVKALGDGEKYDDSKYSARLTYEGSAVGPTEEETIIPPEEDTKIPTVEETPVKTPTEVVGEESKTIVFYHAMGASLREVLDVKIEEFENLNPGWEIDAIYVGGYEDIYNTIMGNMYYNNTPDIAYCYNYHVADYISSGKVIDLIEFLESANGYSEEEINDFFHQFLTEGFGYNFADHDKYGYQDYSVLTMPFLKTTEVMYFNQDALAELGVDVPESWDELWEVCKLAKAKWPNCTPLGYDSEANWFLNMVMQNDWDCLSNEDPYYQFNNVDTINWLYELTDYYNMGLFTTQEIYGSYTSNLFVKGPKDGGCIFAIGSSAGASYHSSNKFTWGVTQVPGSLDSQDEVNYATYAYGPSLVMFESNASNASEKELMTWEFMKLLLEPEAQAMFSMNSGYLATRKSTLKLPEYKDMLSDRSHINFATIKLIYDECINNLCAPVVTKDFQEFRSVITSAMIYSCNCMKTPTQALSDALGKLTGEAVDTTLYEAADEFKNKFSFDQNKSDEYVSLPSGYTYKNNNIKITDWSCDSSYVEINGYKMFVNDISYVETVRVYATLEYNGQTTRVSFEYKIKPNYSEDELLKQWFYEDGVTQTISGYIVAIAQEYDPNYQNMSLYFVNDSFTAGYYAYRLPLDDETHKLLLDEKGEYRLGTHITIYDATNTNYYGLVETATNTGVLHVDTNIAPINVDATYQYIDHLLENPHELYYRTSTLVALDDCLVHYVEYAVDANRANNQVLIVEKDGHLFSVNYSRYVLSTPVPSYNNGYESETFINIRDKVSQINVGDYVNIRGLLSYYNVNKERAVDGSFVINMVNENSIILTGTSNNREYIEVSEFINRADTVNSYLLHGYVTAVNSLDSANSFIFTGVDGTSIFCYEKNNYVSLGDEIVIEATYTSYNSVPQLSNVMLHEVISNGNDPYYVSGYLESIHVSKLYNYIGKTNEDLVRMYGSKFLKITGTLINVNGYYGLALDSTYNSYIVNIYLHNGFDIASYIGQEVELYCFVRGVNSEKYITVQTQLITPAGNVPSEPTPDPQPTPEPTPIPEPAPMYTTIEYLSSYKPTTNLDQIYVVTGTFTTKINVEPANNTYGNGTLSDEFGNSIVLYGLSGTSACLTFTDGLYTYKNSKDFLTLGVVDGSVIKVGMVYTPKYDNYSAYLIEITGQVEVEEK